jgi:hypothetical protein
VLVEPAGHAYDPASEATTESTRASDDVHWYAAPLGTAAFAQDQAIVGADGALLQAAAASAAKAIVQAAFFVSRIMGLLTERRVRSAAPLEQRVRQRRRSTFGRADAARFATFSRLDRERGPARKDRPRSPR